MECIEKRKRLPLIKSLVANGVSVTEFQEWRQTVFKQSNIDLSIPILTRKGLITGLDQEAKPLPPWLLLYLVGYKVRAPHHAANTLLSLTFSNFDHMPIEAKSGVLIFAMLHLARFNLVATMAQIIDAFLTIPFASRNATLHFNLFLVSISRTPLRSEATAEAVLRVLIAMESRQLKLHDYTYRFLLEDRYITVQLTKVLRERMVQEGFIPTADHLEAYLRIFAKNGLIEDAEKYHEAIHSLSSEHHKSRANTLLLASKPDPASAFDFFHKLSPEPHGAPAMTPTDWNAHTMWFPHAPSSSARWRAGPRRSFSVYDWTAAFSVASRDRKNVSARTLIKLFESSNQSVRTRYRASFRPTVVTYIVLLRGLLRREEWQSAEQYFIKLLRSGLRVEKFSLSLGLQALVRVGKMHLAFRVLEEYCSRVDAQSPAQYKIRHPITLTIASMNTFLVSLVQAGRPDVVFKLWESLDKLYGVHHDERTMSCLIQATRAAMIQDDTLWAKMEEVKRNFKELWGGKSSMLSSENSSTNNREELTKPIIKLLFDGPESVPKPKLRPYYPSITWSPLPPHIIAKHTFYQALFTYQPSLLSIKASPILPIVSDINSEGFHLFKILPSIDPAASLGRVRWVLPAHVKQFIKKHNRFEKPYPAFVPSDKNFTHFMLLLAMESQTSPSPLPSSVTTIRETSEKQLTYEVSLTHLGIPEIPLLLAWMRRLGITPSKDTLVLALVLWREVNLQAPLIEMFVAQKSPHRLLQNDEELPDDASPPAIVLPDQPQKKGTERKRVWLETLSSGHRKGPGQIQYEKLVFWMAQWVGWENMPDPRHAAFAKFMKIVERLRRPPR